MTHFKWLKKEVPRWVKEEIITREAGDSLISLYRNEEHTGMKNAILMAKGFSCWLPYVSSPV